MGVARFLVPYRWRIVAAMLALIVAAVSVLALGQGLKVVIDNGFGSRDATQAIAHAFFPGPSSVVTVSSPATARRMSSTVSEPNSATVRPPAALARAPEMNPITAA